MSEDKRFLLPFAGARRHKRGALYLVGLGLSVFGLGGTAAAATPPAPTQAGFAISLIAVAPKGASNCDNIASLDGDLFLACRNAARGAGGGRSTIAEYTESGSLINAWSIPDEAVGIGADQLNHRLIVALNEDANSRLATITPSAPAAQQVENYKYSPGAPSSPATTGTLHTGGGTDSVSVDSTGDIYITASHATDRTGTAVFKVALNSPPSPGGTGVAALSPTFLDNATATDGNPGGGTITLSLGGVGASAIVPYASPLYAGSFAIDDQRARMLVFAGDISAGSGLTVLKTPVALSAIRWTATANGTLYIVDEGLPTAKGVAAIYKVTGPFVPGIAFASSDHEVVTVNLATGALTPFVSNLTHAMGLVYLDPSGTDTPLALAPLAATSAPNAAVPATGVSENYTTMLLVLVFVLLLIGGGYEVLRRRQRTAERS